MTPIRLLPFVLLAALWLPPVLAQPSAAPAVDGRTLEGKPFSLAGLRGKVVLLMFWSTDCAVCRDKMPELRQNYEGWARQARSSWCWSAPTAACRTCTSYEEIISRTVPLKQRFVQLWAGEPATATIWAGPRNCRRPG
jgi:thiol-disulfide isomerase/thioredoxin